MDDSGTLRNLKENAKNDNKLDDLVTYLNDFKVQIVLTAHPTLFYIGSVLGIITDLAKAVKTNDVETIIDLLPQLGKTAFFNE